jgi:hypothetical protein
MPMTLSDAACVEPGPVRRVNACMLAHLIAAGLDEETQ